MPGQGLSQSARARFIRPALICAGEENEKHSGNLTQAETIAPWHESAAIGWMESTHLYLDEAGNFDFGPNGTRWLVLTCVKIPWDSQRIAHLAQLRHDLLLEGIGLEYFHASEDNRRVRQRFLGKIAPWLPPSSVKARALLKQDIDERLRAPERFYPAFVGPLVERHIGQGNERVWVFSDTLPLNKKRHGLEKAIAAELASRSTGQGTHTFLHHASKSNFDLQIADYCCWAIWRSLTKGDHQAMDILGQAVDLQE